MLTPVCDNSSMNATAAPTAVVHYVLKITNRTNVEIVGATTDWSQAISMQVGLEDVRFANGVPAATEYYIVRNLGDQGSLVEQGYAARHKLTSKQSAVLKVLAAKTAEFPRWGYRPSGETVAGYYSTDIVSTARTLAKKGLISIKGVNYGPKTYFVTGDGRVVAAGILEQAA